MVGTLHTENLGIERLIQNVLANPHLRFVIVCGPDSQQVVGHYPGQSLAALAQHGIDDRRRIIGAQGRRPILKNLSPEAVAHFREVVEVIDLIGETDALQVLSEAKRCAARNPGPAKPYGVSHIVTPVPGYLPARMVGDPAGYFVIYVDRARGILSLEHYRNDGLLDIVIEGSQRRRALYPGHRSGPYLPPGPRRLPGPGTGPGRGEPALRGTVCPRCRTGIGCAPHPGQRCLRACLP